MAPDPLAIEASTPLQSSQLLPAAQGAAPQNPQDSAAGTLLPADQVSLSGNPDTKYQELQQKHDQINAAAGAIRHADRSLKLMGQKIDGLKAPLETIVKNFPPFSAEDKARVHLLKQYSSLRKEIDELTLPQPPEVVQARKAAALPAPLPMDATDSQIADHVAKLDATAASVNDTRAGIAADTTSFLQDGRFAELFTRSAGALAAASEPPLTESAAVQKSAQVGRQFATAVSQGVSGNGSQFLKRMS